METKETTEEEEFHTCEIKLRENPQRRKDKVFIGCGAGFAGDRPFAALKLLQRVPELDYLVLECLAERTLVDRYQNMLSGGHGYDPFISDWMCLLLPLAMERGTCIITNMGAVDPLGAQKVVLDIASRLRLNITIAVAYEVPLLKSGFKASPNIVEGGVSTYLGAAPILQCLEKYKPNVIITSRLADAALFLGPMVYELGWNWNDFDHLAQGLLAGHLLECGCQLTGGYFMHPGDKYRSMSFEHLLDLSLPFAEVGFDGKVCLAKTEGSGGVINFSTCAEQLLYEVGDTGAYITPDVVIDLRDVSFSSLSVDKVMCTGAKPSDHVIPDKLLQLVPKDYGWKGWGEISYGGHGCVERAKASEFLVRSWMDEAFPGVHKHIISYIIGFDSLKATNRDQKTATGRDIEDIRLRMDGLFELKEQVIHFIKEFTALYTNGPAGGGGISTGYKKEIILEKNLVSRESVFWCTRANHPKAMDSWTKEYSKPTPSPTLHEPIRLKHLQGDCSSSSLEIDLAPAPSGQKIPLYNVAHSRAGDKGNNLNLSIIPHFLPDIERLKVVITPDWVEKVVSTLLDASSFANQDDITVQKGEDLINKNVQVKIYEAKGIHSLNIVINNILDGGVNCSRRIDRHGKTISDLILCQEIVLPPPP